MTTSSPLRATSVQETLDIIRTTTALLPIETTPLNSALHRILREAVTATTDQPEFDRSAVDGFAVLRGQDAGVFEIVDHIRAGDWKPRTLMLGQAVGIATGAALPGEGLVVVMKEDAQVEGNRVHLSALNGEPNVRFRGEDMRAGQVLAAPGTCLSAGALALMASLGNTSLAVTRRPRVLHVVTGNEIVDASQAPGPGQIRDSNSILVREFLRGWNVELAQARAGEDAADIRATIASSPFAADQIDMLLISGGASVGEHDFSRRILEELGWNIHVQRTNSRPGKPLVFGTRQGLPAFALPGNPLAHFVCLNLYVHGALEALFGSRTRAGFCPGYLAEPLECEKNPRAALWPAIWALSDRGAEVSLLPWRSSGDLTPLARANALACIPGDTHRLAAGTHIQFQPLVPYAC